MVDLPVNNLAKQTEWLRQNKAATIPEIDKLLEPNTFYHDTRITDKVDELRILDSTVSAPEAPHESFESPSSDCEIIDLISSPSQLSIPVPAKRLSD